MAPFVYSTELTQAERNKISMALESSRVCSAQFGAASNPFGRVPQGARLTTLRSVVGKKIRVVDYRLATEAERNACTRAISRPGPKFDGQWTLSYAFVQTVDVAYDVGIGGVVVNVRDTTGSRASRENLGQVTIAAEVAARASSFANPVLDGEQLYCINIGERMRRIYDGHGLITGDRSFISKFVNAPSSDFGFPAV